MKIVYEDKYIAVVIKPYGIISQIDSSVKESAVSLLQEQCGCEIYPVHRLDRTTLGIMVFAKSKQAAAALSQDIAQHRFKKRYIAVIHGKPELTSGTMSDLLYFDRKENKVFTVKRNRSGVKKAELEYALIGDYAENSEKKSCVEIMLKTGRTHQIRVQFASRHMPLLGDRRYGADDNYKKIALCAESIDFIHPVNGSRMKFSICGTNEFEEWKNYFIDKKDLVLNID